MNREEIIGELIRDYDYYDESGFYYIGNIELDAILQKYECRKIKLIIEEI